MSVFAVQYKFVDDSDAVAAIRPNHREWLAGLLEEGVLLASGPMVDSPRALLIFSSDTIEFLNDLLNQDPYEIAGVLAERTISQWNPIYGPFSEQ